MYFSGDITKGSHQKKVKKFHNKCELSQKWRTPYFTTVLADFGT